LTTRRMVVFRLLSYPRLIDRFAPEAALGRLEIQLPLYPQKQTQDASYAARRFRRDCGQSLRHSMRSEHMQPLLREIGQPRRLIYNPNCEMAHRREPFSLVVLSGWLPSVGLRAVRFRSWLACKSMRHFRRIVMRGFNRLATMVCASLILLESTLSG
jgi:hypothetical protein